MLIHLASLLAMLMEAPAGAPQESTARELEAAACDPRAALLWERSLCLPVVVVDPATGTFSTSRSPPGPLPAFRANTAFDWEGTRWVMLLGPLPPDPAAMASLLYHEAWHGHQDAIGFPANNTVAGALEEMSARALLRLEWAALAEALRTGGAVQRGHVAQALAFRRQRHEQHPGLADAEREQMRHEGLASYTGVALSGAPRRLALEEIEGAAARSSLPRSFAYVSGPAWGLVLDAIRPGWRGVIRLGGDLPDLVPVPPASVALGDRYGATAVLAEESLRSLERQTKLTEALALTDPARALRLPLAEMTMDFDPNQVIVAPDGSNIHFRITLSDRWGTIALDGQPLRIAPDFTAAFAPWPTEGALALSDGWQIADRPKGRTIAPNP